MMSHWSRYLIRRLFTSSLVVFGVVTAVFIVQRAVPGDPVDNLLGEHATRADRDALREHLGLNESLSSQYVQLWEDVFNGSLGQSYEMGQASSDVSSLIAVHFPATLELAFAGVLLAILIAVPLGLFAAFRAHTFWDHVCAFVALVGIAIPNFWLGPMLLYVFAVQYQIFPDPGDDLQGLYSLALPAIVLGTALSGKLMRMVRASVLDVLHAPHVMAARSKGLHEWLVIKRHVLRNALNPVVTVLSLQFAALLTGAIVTEKVFARPGLGTLLLDAITTRNYPVVQGTVIVIAIVYTLVNLLTDVIYGLLDPRMMTKDQLMVGRQGHEGWT
jgi:ABC-type dipeptide/oligopeptide/nickel transport system permease component